MVKSIKKAGDRVLSLFLCVVLMFGLIVPFKPIHAQEMTPNITVTSSDVYPGRTTWVYVYLNNVSNLGGLEYSLNFDENVFEVVNCYDGYVISGTSGDINYKQPGQIKHSFISLDGVNESGTMMYFELKAKADAPQGTYPITVMVGEAYDTNFNNLSLEKNSGSIMVNPKPAAQDISFGSYMDNHEAQINDIVTYSLMSYNVYNLAGGQFEFTYDSNHLQLEDVKIRDEIIRENTITSINKDREGTVIISYIDTEFINDYTYMFDLTFKVISNIETSTYIECQFSDLADYELNPLKASNSSTSINLKEIIIEEELPKMWLDWDGVFVDGNKMYVDLYVEGSANLAAGDFVIQYDKNHVLAKKAQKASSLGSSAWIITKDEIGEGEIRFSYVNTNVPKEDTHLMELEFEMQDGFSSYTEIELTSESANDTQYNKILLSYQSLEVDFRTELSDCEVKGIKDVICEWNEVYLDIQLYDGEKLLVENQDYVVSYSNNYGPGTATITITGINDYKGEYQDTFEIKQINYISVTKYPDKTTYIEQGESLDTTGGELTVYYTNGSSDVIDLSQCDCWFENSWIGTTYVEVYYKEHYTNFPVEIIQKSVSGISIWQVPYTTSYAQNTSSLELWGGILEVRYNNNTYDTINFDDYRVTVTGFDNRTPGIQTLTVHYEGFEATYNVEIRERQVYDISLMNSPYKYNYIEGEKEIDMTGAQIVVYYDNGETEYVSVDNSWVTGFDANYTGHQYPSINYLGHSIMFEIYVEPRYISDVSIETLPSKLTYLEGKDQLDVSDGVLAVRYNYSLTEYIPFSEAVVFGLNNTLVGTQTIIVDYQGHQVQYNVEVIAKSPVLLELTKYPSQIEFLEGKDQLDLSEAQFTVYYDNGQQDTYPFENIQVEGFDNTKPGRQTITFYYGELTGTFEVTIIPKSLIDIELVTPPTKLSYLEAKEELDVTGSQLKLKYDNGTFETIDVTKDMVSGFDNTKVGKQTLTIQYQEYEVMFEIDIIAKSLIGISMIASPFNITYLEGKDNLDLTGGAIELLFDNETTSIVQLSDTTVTGFDNTKPGIQTLTVVYEGFETTFNVHIIEKEIVSVTIESLPKKVKYYVDDKLNLAEGQLLVSYNNDTTEIVDMTNATIISYDNQTIGEQIVVLAYEGYDIKFGITVSEKPPFIYGDINSDGKVNSFDRNILARYIANWDGYDIDNYNKDAADVNVDGKVNSFDRNILARHIAAWDGYETLPYQ